MPKYLIEANYVGEGINGLLKEGGTKRRAAVDELFKSMGGAVEAFLLCLWRQGRFSLLANCQTTPLPRHSRSGSMHRARPRAKPSC
ncbi:hypothetical protein ACFS07_25625 [Undibacterium arcticum]